MNLIKRLFKKYYIYKWGREEADLRFVRAKSIFRGINHFTNGGGLATIYNVKGEQIRHRR